MNIKWATLTVGALFGFAHIGILGHILNRPQYPIINFPDGDYSSFKVQSGKNGYSFEYKANDPTVLESTKSLMVDKDKRGLLVLRLICDVKFVVINIRWTAPVTWEVL